MNKQNAIHTVLGANGAMGKALADELKNRRLNYKLISKSNDSNNQEIEQANLLNKVETLKAIEGSQFVYLCVGLPYSYSVWAEQWSIIMQNVIEACSVHKSKLIFFDNVYLYSNPLPVPFDENTEQKPTSRKGKVRKQIADMFLKAIEENRIDGLIARSADFYGPKANNSILYISILEKMLNDKKPQSLSSGNVEHTYSYLEDNARAIMKLSLSRNCYGKVWHLPASIPISFNQVVEIFNQELKKEDKLQVMPKYMGSILSWFIPVIKEAKEMQYQFNSEYKISDKKFMTQFPEFKTTPIERGLIGMVRYFKNASG